MAENVPPRRRRRARRLRSLTRAQRQIAGLMVVALAVGIAALVFALHPAPPPSPYTATAPPLALSGRATPSSTAVTSQVASTVRLLIPAGNINIGVVEGDGVHVPMNLAAHYPGTSQPGELSNSVYYAHAQPGMFQGLFKLHLGDEVRAIEENGTQVVFHVAAIKRVPFNDRGVLDSTPFGEVTLLTCTSYDPYTPRYIVIATQS